MSTALERLLAAVVDGRTENVRYRQDQLQNLHGTLREEASNICNALSQDSGCSSAEVETEYYLGMDAVRHFYDSLDFEKSLEEEYAVANGKNNETRRLGKGLVIIRPTSHSRFYSIVSPLAAAISAGNCVVLELQDTLLQIDSVLRAALKKALDVNSFYISKTVIVISDNLNLDSSALLVDQTGSTPTTTSGGVSLTNQLISSTNARVIAIVDRTADIHAAARAITTARFSFGGTSPYAPDLVLVNEFVKKDFFEACSKYASLAFASLSSTSVKKVSSNMDDTSKKAVKEAEDKRQVSSFGSDEFKLVDILDKGSPVMNMKITGRYLPIATCSSLVDAIFTREFEGTLLAGYFFAEPRAAKYLAQHLDCHLSCVNQIPVQLLVGPAAPIAHPPEYLYSYSKEMFSVSRPQYVEQLPREFKFVENAMGMIPQGKEQQAIIRRLAVKPLKPTGQPKHEGLSPVHLFSHGTTMMLGEEHSSARYWEACGDAALAAGVEHVVMMGAHWATSLPGILISANPSPDKSPVAYVHPGKYKPYPLNPDIPFVPTIASHLSSSGIPSHPDPKFDWIHDTYLVLIRMFPRGCPPTTVISMNGSFDPHFHVAVGAALRPLRDMGTHKTLFIGSGGSVHNLYRNVWGPMIRYRDNFAQPTPPEPWALDFRQEVIDTFCPGYEEGIAKEDDLLGGRKLPVRNREGVVVGGPRLRRKVTSLMKHPRYRDAHATDDHFMAAMFVAGLCGDREDEQSGIGGEMGAEDWELTNMCNSQFTLGSWD
ncbi:Extradiol ring-cleavage dioxygenase, class III enzyme, subunit B [Diplogelasinospora grovesii]|uniref:Extradiol ring-cleavage dioxygenase, class III enzyme, subunit B n=1 Tax=Diplogelasinospora grovesii TaxID=303347 RepID=A0AAN6S4F9_9PEZI|nr:Extradiol ring-cleavage dioxygenase, class III enzyme, subunit B [Diplogelasinospora grovesii]